MELMVREHEVDLVEDLIDECEQDFREIMKRETDEDYDCKLTVI